MAKFNIYDTIKDNMATGDILQWHSYSTVGTLIRWKTKQKNDQDKNIPNHSSMIIRLSEWEGLERRRFHTEAMERGVYPNLLSNRLKLFEGRVWWLPLKQEWDSKREEIGMRLTECWGKSYDYKSLLWQLVGKVSVDARQLFCSETLDFALNFKGKAHTPRDYDSLGINRDRILIFDSKYVKVIFSR